MSALSAAKSLVDAARNKHLALQEWGSLAVDLAAKLLAASEAESSLKERQAAEKLARMMEDDLGKAFTIQMCDQVFRTDNSERVLSQMVHLLQTLKTPAFVSRFERIGLVTTRILGNWIPSIFAPLVRRAVRKEAARVIMPAEEAELATHLAKREKEGTRVNLNYLGEAILGSGEADSRFSIYVDMLQNPAVEYVSVKISSICAHVDLLDYERTQAFLQERLAALYRLAMAHFYKGKPKFINLDMEEFRDLALTVSVFKAVLDKPEFASYSAGIVLQAYLPDSFPIQQELTRWALARQAKGGAPIKVRIVKGANLAMEKVESSLHGWRQAPYESKVDVDASYKNMLVYALSEDRSKAVNIGVASHNLFDIAFAILLRASKGVEADVCFEMLEGMADPVKRCVQKLTGSMLVYCPIARRQEFQNAVAYLIRRLDENTGPENFLRHSFGLKVGSKAWESEKTRFLASISRMDTVPHTSHRMQNRQTESFSLQQSFANEADTDWTLPWNKTWVEEGLKAYRRREHEPIPLVISGRTIVTQKFEWGCDPSLGNAPFYRTSQADSGLASQALEQARIAAASWSKTPVAERCQLAYKLAKLLRENRLELICALVADAGKSVREADAEVSEAIDFVQFYASEMLSKTGKAKGVILVASPWNFPCAIACGGMVAALLTGNAVLFKPAPEVTLVGWTLVQLFWKAGFSQLVLQFINCPDDPVGSQIVKDLRLDAVILTGASATARLLLNMRPDLELFAETGGKNSIIATELCDRDLLIKDLLRSAFSHAGQKCSAASLAILAAPLYDDKKFLAGLLDAAASLKVAPAWDLGCEVSPLICEARPELKRALTTLELGESWLLEPRQDKDNPQLWSPGIKLGVLPGSTSHLTEFFGPVLGLVRAESFLHAIEIANSTPYGLTAGIHSLDDREVRTWLGSIEAGNLYVNRSITGAIVSRQPFGGAKASSFGSGAKAGGKHYLDQFMDTKNPAPCEPELTGEVVGEDNIHTYKKRRHVLLRFGAQDSPETIRTIVACAKEVLGAYNFSVSLDQDLAVPREVFDEAHTFHVEDEHSLAERLADLKTTMHIERIRTLHKPERSLFEAAAALDIHIGYRPFIGAEFEKYFYVREVSVALAYHRYGNTELAWFYDPQHKGSKLDVVQEAIGS